MRIIITTIALLIAAAGPAFAHAHLDHASPAVGSTVAQAPKEVVLWFTNELEPAFSSIEVRDEKGAAMQAGKAGVDRGNRTQLRVPLKSLPPGNLQSDLARVVCGYPPHARRFHLPRWALGPAEPRRPLMADPLILVRGVHFAATLLAGGTVAFMVLVAEPAGAKIRR